MRGVSLFVGSLVWFLLATEIPFARAQFGDDKKPAAKPAVASATKTNTPPASKNSVAASPPANGIKFDQKKSQRWKCGIVITAAGGPCVGLYGTTPVPTDWPEQTVRIVEEEITPTARVTYRTLESGVKQMIVNIPNLSAGEKATALVTFEVTRSSIVGPEDTSGFSIPERVPTNISKYLGPSPKIESRHPDITKLAKEILAGKDKATDWEKVEALYDWVREHVEYQNGNLKGALAALKDKTGDCEEMTSLFIAFCRANKIPARTVWIPDHCYPEFYLVDKKGEGHWFPCQAAGTRDFGGIPEFRPVLQKGDNVKVPEKKESFRYVPEFLTGTPTPGGGKPNVEFVRLLLQN